MTVNQTDLENHARPNRPQSGDAQPRLPFERAENRAALIEGLPIDRRGRMFLVALADLCWELTGGPTSGGPLGLLEIAKKMGREDAGAARRAMSKVCPKFVTADEDEGNGYRWTINVSRIVDASKWTPGTVPKMRGVPIANARGSGPKMRGVPLANARGSDGDPHSNSESKELRAQRSRARAELLKLAGGRWPKNISADDLAAGRRVWEIWRLTVEIRHFEDCPRWRDFVFQAAVQARDKGRRSAGGMFTTLVAMRTPGSFEFPDDVIRTADEMVRRLTVANTPRVSKPDGLALGSSLQAVIDSVDIDEAGFEERRRAAQLALAEKKFGSHVDG